MMQKMYYWKYKNKKEPFEIIYLLNDKTVVVHRSQYFIPLEIDPNDDIITTILKKSTLYKSVAHMFRDTTELIEGVLLPNCYYPRIYRPFIALPKRQSDKEISYKEHIENRFITLEEKAGLFEPLLFDKNKKEILQSIEQLESLVIKLHEIFRVIFPSETNLKTYGNEIRNLILLACMEVESQLKGILVANNYTTNSFLKTTDYVKLLPILKLDEYTIKLSNYPWMPILEPFKNWSSQDPTKSLDWYSDYNKIKHDRENSMSKATLLNAINSIAACFILLKAQYGDLSFFSSTCGSFFFFEKKPFWEYNEKYIPHLVKEGWNPIFLAM